MRCTIVLIVVVVVYIWNHHTKLTELGCNNLVVIASLLRNVTTKLVVTINISRNKDVVCCNNRYDELDCNSLVVIASLLWSAWL